MFIISFTHLLGLLTIASLNIICNMIGRHRYQDKSFDMFDILQDIIPTINYKYSKICDTITLLNILIVYWYDLLPYFLNYYIPVMLIRGICINLTIVPKSAHYKLNALVKAGVMAGNYDKIYSGHTCCYILSLLTLLSCETTSSIVIFMLGLLMSLSFYILLATRSHYSLDIWLGAVVSVLYYNSNISLIHNLFTE